MKAHYFISNQYGTSDYELVKEMMLLVKKNTQCCGSRNRKRILGENFIWSLTENGVDSDYIIELNQIFGVIITGRKN